MPRLFARAAAGHHRAMGYFPWSLSLMAVSAIVAGIVGAVLPSGQRLDTILALIAGAGAAVLVIAVGLLIGANGRSVTAMERLLFEGTCVGTAAVAVVLVLLWRHARRYRGESRRRPRPLPK